MLSVAAEGLCGASSSGEASPMTSAVSWIVTDLLGLILCSATWASVFAGSGATGGVLPAFGNTSLFSTVACSDAAAETGLS